MGRVVLNNVSKSFDVPRQSRVLAVRGFSLEVADGELLTLVGPSGCGKTTILRLIAGLEVPDKGTIIMDGRVMNQVEPKDRGVAMVFQNHALYPHKTVRENLTFGLELRKVAKEEIIRRVTAATEMLGLTPVLDRLPKTLSAGQRQRAALGRAVVLEPKVLLLDEPLSSLNAPLRTQMRIEIMQLHQRLGATMIHVTHDQTEAMTMGQRVAIMNEGTIQQVASPSELFQNPANQFVAKFIGLQPPR